MATLKELRDERLRKLEELKQLGINPYPADTTRTHVIADVVDKFDQLEGQTVTVVGRLVTTRKFGKLAFLVLRDMSGQVQLFLKTDTVEALTISWYCISEECTAKACRRAHHCRLS